jgi:RNA polymerase primary sigma factor
MKSLRLNQACIDALVEQLYDINKRLVGHEGRLIRLAESHGVVREDFLRNYQGSELDPHWLDGVSKLSARGWNSFVARDTDRIKELRGRAAHRLPVMFLLAWLQWSPRGLGSKRPKVPSRMMAG